ncbi:arylesterase [Rhodocyclus tenuis]|uniref:arylesterase n=1 Tax=Rhodocyclus tenuis TaxID=1066 RepID=UPI001F5BB9DD|nr:arylesterase [Rhodocyclus tenuis]MBK1679645.1 arylesterase [Rhodocyclus tenuis]
MFISRLLLSCKLPLLAAMLSATLLLLAPTAQAARDIPRNILIFGDSLSAGYGIRQDAAWPALLAKRLDERKLEYSVVNASISGETSSGGRARINALLARHQPTIVVIALGANDGLRGLPIATLRDNLAAITESAQRSKARVLIVGQRLPPNYGNYAEEFHAVFGEVARKRKTALVDFLLEGVASEPQLFQADNLHPTAAAQPRLLDNVWNGLAPLLR